MTETINGKIVYQNLGTGFWGIEATNGQQYRPVNMPEQLKHEGARVHLIVREVKEEMSIFMWGKAVRVLSFHTLSP